MNSMNYTRDISQAIGGCHIHTLGKQKKLPAWASYVPLYSQKFKKKEVRQSTSKYCYLILNDVLCPIPEIVLVYVIVNRMNIFYVIRHAQTQWNEKGLLQGHSDSPLTKKGIEQAFEMKKNLKDFDLVFSSDFGRAKSTAKIIANKVKTTKLLRERNFAHLEGKPYDSSTLDQKHPDIESNEEALRRFKLFIKNAVHANPGKRSLVVTHGGIIRSLLSFLGQPNFIDNCKIIMIESDGNNIWLKE